MPGRTGNGKASVRTGNDNAGVRTGSKHAGVRTGNGNGDSSKHKAGVLMEGYGTRTSAAYAPYLAFLYIRFLLRHGLRRVQRVRIHAVVDNRNDVLRAAASAMGALQIAYPRMGDAIERAVARLWETGAAYAWFDNGLVLVRSKGLSSTRRCKISVHVLYA
jgi:hypothetical protein